VKANPRFGPPREALSKLLLEDGENGSVIGLLAPIYEAYPDRFEILALLGEAYFQQQNFSRTNELLEKAITIEQPDSRVLNLLAVSRYETGNLERARQLLERSLSLNPDQPRAKELLEKITSRNKTR
jgi:Flp pilus assembly protein TadD